MRNYPVLRRKIRRIHYQYNDAKYHRANEEFVRCVRCYAEQETSFVNLSKGTLGDINSTLLGLIMVSKIQMAAMRRQNVAKEDRSDFFLYIDEFRTTLLILLSPSFPKLVNTALDS